MKYKIYNQDVIEWAKSYGKKKFHALLSDAPYELNFMGQKWDRSGVAFDPETWSALGEHLYPGAFGMAFSASRNWHRLAVAIEDAGFIIHPTIFLWSYGCLSDDTEILTEDGWKSYRDIIVGYKVMCYNLNTKELSYMPVENIYEYDYKDTAYRIQSDSTDQLVSRNHRVIVERNGAQVFQFAETLEQQEIVPILEDMQVLSESLHSSKCGRVSQKESLFSNVCSRIIQAFQNRKNLETKKSTSKKGIISTEREVDNLSGMQEKSMETGCLVKKDNRISHLFQKMQWSSTSKRTNKAFSRRSSRLDRKKSTGISREDVRSEQSCMERWGNLLSQTWELFTNQVREMSIRIFGNGSEGWVCDGASAYGSTSNWKMPYSFRGSTSQRPQSSTQLVGELHAISEQLCTQELRSTWIPRTTVATVTPVQYEGIVWCVKVPTGAFVARRNGKVFITGNSGFPKATRVHKQGEGDFDGHRYGLQALKPAVEPIICFQKPFEDKPRVSIPETGAGALNIDGARIPLNGDSYQINTFDDGAKPFGNGAGHKYTSRKVTNRTSNKFSGTAYNNGEEGHFRDGDTFADADPKGRWPANLILDGSAERLDKQTGILTSGKPSGVRKAKNNIYGQYAPGLPVEGIGDSGGASRFFYNVSQQLDENDPVYYCGKVSPKERNAGLDEKNNHPTLKPIDLARYLATLLLPPEAYAPRRILIPFSGVASEMVGAALAGWEQIVGVEFDTENGYVDIAHKRMEYWTNK